MLSTNQESDRWKAWDNFLERTSQTGFMQSSWWADFRLTAGYEHFATILKSRNEIIGGAVIMKFSYTEDCCFYYIPDGPVIPENKPIREEVFRSILNAIDDRRIKEEQIVSHLRIEPRWKNLPKFAADFLPVIPFSDPYVEPRNTLYINLTFHEEVILAQMKPKGRYNIRVAQKHGVTVIEDMSERGLTDFINLYCSMTERQGIEAKPNEYFQIMFSLLESLNKGSIYFAEYKGKRIAAAIVIYFGNMVTYFFGASSAEHRNVMAPYLLHFEIMCKTKKLGYKVYDFWGIAPLNEMDHPWRGISIFKRKFGGEEVKFVQTLDYIYNKNAYEIYLKSESKIETIKQQN